VDRRKRAADIIQELGTKNVLNPHVPGNPGKLRRMSVYRHLSFLATGLLAFLLPACTTLPIAELGHEPAQGPPAAQADPPTPGVGVPSEPTKPNSGAAEASPVTDVMVAAGAGEEDWLKDWARGFWSRTQDDICLSCEDYRHYYTMGNLAALGAGIAVAAPLANTSVDMDIHHWYQRHVRGETTDEWAQVANYAGEFWIVLPVAMQAAALSGCAPEDFRFDSGLYEWSNRTLRATLVGAPPMLAMYVILGASRPDRENSRWHPFQDVHGVSGHTFMGAIPFLTAAAMTDNEWLKVPLVAGSFITGWSRINDDRHFFSQMALGWWMAFLAVERVNDTQLAWKAVTVGPGFTPDGPGVVLQLRY
jgi:hypothetical protein